MSLPNNRASAIEKKLSETGKAKSLNPDAAAFVPFALRSPSRTTSIADTGSSFENLSASTPGKAAILDRSESSVSNNSDDEVHQFWRHQLPDDITPDFNVAGEEESSGINSVPFSALSIADVNGTWRQEAARGGGYMSEEKLELSPPQINGGSFARKMRYPLPAYGENPSPASFQQTPSKPWDIHGGQLLTGIRDGPLYNGEILNEQQMEGMEVNPLGFLASQFPGFAAESLVEVYYANGCDLNLTIEMLTQLELQVDNGLNPNLNSKALSAPNLSALDFPALSPTENQSIPKFPDQQNVNSYRSMEKDLLMFKSSSAAPPSLGATDFASAVRKMAAQDSGMWKYDRNLTQNPAIGSSRSSHVLASSYSGGHGRGSGGYGDRLVNRSSTRSVPVWLETGEAVANMYSEMRGEARDHARLRNTYFEQARQAYLVGYKALAKELSVKGQLHNMQMKVAHGKAQESIYHQRNPVSPDTQVNGRGGQERIIDLHGLHVSEAIHVLKRELMILRNVARSAEQRLQVYICVGTGHHTRGTRTPARLPVAVQRYLLEEEGLDYSEPQPGLLRVVLF